MKDRSIVIEPVTRIEGDARIIITLDETGNVRTVHYQVLELRGFEAFCRGRYAEEMPRIAQAICGVCSTPHHLASAKAVDTLYGRKPPEAAVKIREFVHHVYMIDDHLLHFAVMALPDLLVEGANTVRGFVDIVKRYPEIVKKLINARALTSGILERLCGKSIHMPIAIPGGVSRRPSREDLEFVEKRVKELKEHILFALDLFKHSVLKSQRVVECMKGEEYSLKTYYMGLVGTDGSLSMYDGILKVVDWKGREVMTFKPEEYTKYIAEHHEEWSYSKFPYLVHVGWRGFEEESTVRVGPLARLNVCSKLPTELASEEYKVMREFFGNEKIVNNTLAYHWARLIENVHAYEVVERILTENRDSILRDEVVNFEGKPLYEGVGIVEAARGVLIHHYKVDQNFIVKEVNVITPTAINNAAINTQLRKIVIGKGTLDYKDPDLADLVARLEMAVRAFDPCNSCATHTAGSHTVKLLIYDSRGNLVKVIS
ncbi:MAG: Ni/Fe hydrogenase subunit alpha [Desulfurococcaceae archaeon]